MADSRRHLKIAGCAIVAAVFGAAVVNAQREQTVEMDFVVFSDVLPKNVKFVPDRKSDPVELQFFSSARSPTFHYSGVNQLTFFAEVEVPPNPSQPNAPRIQRVPVGTVWVPVGMRKALILFLSEGQWNPNTIPRYSVSIFDDSPAAVPSGHAVFLNTTGQPYFGTAGGREIAIPAGLSQPIKIEPGQTKVFLNRYGTAGRIPIFSGMIPLGSNQRVTVVLLPPYSKDTEFLQHRLLYDPNKPPVVARPKEIL